MNPNTAHTFILKLLKDLDIPFECEAHMELYTHGMDAAERLTKNQLDRFIVSKLVDVEEYKFHAPSGESL